MSRIYEIKVVPAGTIVQEMITKSIVPAVLDVVDTKVVPGDWAVNGRTISCVETDVDAVKKKLEGLSYEWKMADD